MITHTIVNNIYKFKQKRLKIKKEEKKISLKQTYYWLNLQIILVQIVIIDKTVDKNDKQIINHLEKTQSSKKIKIKILKQSRQ